LVTRGKKPFLGKGLLDATCDPATIDRWFVENKGVNVALRTGAESDFWVLDLDSPEALRWLHDMEKKHGYLPNTRIEQSGRTGGGWHFFFKWPKRGFIKSRALKLVKNVETRGENGCIVVTPSIHPETGNPYTILNAAPIAEAPGWLLQLIFDDQAASDPAPAPSAIATAAVSAKIVHPDRWPHLRKLAGSLKWKNASPQTIEAAILEENRYHCDPPYEEPELLEKLYDLMGRQGKTPPPPSPEATTPATFSQQGYSFVQIGELLARPDIPVEYVLDGVLVAGTLSLMVAKPKVGKGTWARNLSIAVARGEPFLGRATKKGLVLYLALEECENDVRRDFKAMGAKGDEELWIHAAPTPSAAVAELLEEIRRRKPVLVVIDPLIRLARIKDEKAYAETYNALGPLIDVARECGAHILLLHHSTKVPKTEAVDSPLGSTAFGGIPATLIYLKRSEDTRTITTVQRIGDDLPETVLLFDKVTKHLTLGRTKREADQAETENRIEDFLKKAKEPQTQRDIREGVEGRRKVVYSGLDALVEAAKIERSGSGKRGDPFIYQFPNYAQKDSVPVSPHVSGDSGTETESATEPHANTGGNAAPGNVSKLDSVPASEVPSSYPEPHPAFHYELLDPREEVQDQDWLRDEEDL
jgi:hypothetical protein